MARINAFNATHRVWSLWATDVNGFSVHAPACLLRSSACAQDDVRLITVQWAERLHSSHAPDNKRSPRKHGQRASGRAGCRRPRLSRRARARRKSDPAPGSAAASASECAEPERVRFREREATLVCAQPAQHALGAPRVPLHRRRRARRRGAGSGGEQERHGSFAIGVVTGERAGSASASRVSRLNPEKAGRSWLSACACEPEV
jgi:hypothetical protein